MCYLPILGLNDGKSITKSNIYFILQKKKKKSIRNVKKTQTKKHLFSLSLPYHLISIVNCKL